MVLNIQKKDTGFIQSKNSILGKVICTYEILIQLFHIDLIMNPGGDTADCPFDCNCCF